MITKKTLAIVMLLTIIGAVACTAKKEYHDEHEADRADSTEDWAAMDEFHMIMAESFHPYKDSSNLEPAKAKAAEMAAAADKWQRAPLPEKVDNDEIKTKLEHLKAETAAFVETSKGSDDQVIGESLTKLHDHFHELQEAWYGGHH